ncbi:hypothetical protein U9M48_026149 [Paspalum notatum var. saurae]|uniref:Rhodanese domain-containing protein n=1 Tax=Paspalum notatum var. saurae TaxID=547442 RepID=A0AAQ3WYQ5_PASNO
MDGAMMATSAAARVSMLLAQPHHPPPSVVVATTSTNSSSNTTMVTTRRRKAPRFVSVVRCSAEAEALRSQQPQSRRRFHVGVDADAEAVPRSVPVRVAYELQQAGHRYLDVRTEGEFSAGHPDGAVNIPYMHRTGSGMTKNTHFLEQVSRIFGKDDEIIVGCQSGKRSLMAATELCSAGFTAVTDIVGGFSSWRENELPVIQ